MKCNVDAVTEARVAVAAAGKVAAEGLKAQASRFGGRIERGPRIVRENQRFEELKVSQGAEREKLLETVRERIGALKDVDEIGPYLSPTDDPRKSTLGLNKYQMILDLQQVKTLEDLDNWFQPVKQHVPEIAPLVDALIKGMPSDTKFVLEQVLPVDSKGNTIPIGGSWTPTTRELRIYQPSVLSHKTGIGMVEIMLHEMTHAVVMRNTQVASTIAESLGIKWSTLNDHTPEWLQEALATIDNVTDDDLQKLGLENAHERKLWRDVMRGHAMGTNVYRYVTRSANMTPAGRKLLSQLVARAEALDFDGFVNSGNQEWTFKYGLSQMEELFAVGLTRPEMQAFLDSLPDPWGEVTPAAARPYKSILQLFKNLFKRILGIADDEVIDTPPEAGTHTALDRILQAGNLRIGDDLLSRDITMEGMALNDVSALQAMERLLENPRLDTMAAEDLDLLVELLRNGKHGLDSVAPGNEQLLADVHQFITHQREMLEQRAAIEASGDSPYSVSPEWADLSEAFLKGLGDDLDKIEEMYETTVAQIAQNALPGFTESVATRLFRSQVPLAQWAAMNLIESPMGFGGIKSRGITAPILAETWHRQHTAKLDRAWSDMLDEEIKVNGTNWDHLRRRYLRNSDPNTNPIAKELARAVMREMNARRLGKPSDAPAHIKAYADTLTEFNDKLYDLQMKHDVDGITGNNKRKHYMRQVWNHGKLFDLLKEPGGERKVTILFTKAMENAYGMDRNTAMQFAWGLIETRKKLMDKRDEYKYSLEDTKDQLVDIVDQIKAKYGSDSAGKVMEALKKHDGGGAGYVETRTLDFDLETEHDGLSIMDLLDHDITGIANVYSKEATGRAAISRVSGGLLNSDARIDDLMINIQRQAALNGTTVDTGSLRDALNTMMGRPVTGALPINARRIRDAVALAGMNGLGESQLAELGLVLSRGMSTLFGLQLTKGRFLSRMHKKMPYRDPTGVEMREEELLDEMLEMTGLYSDFEEYARRNLDYDAYQGNSDRTFLDKFVDTATGGKFRNYLQALQGKYTGYNAIRTMEEQIAMAGLMQDAFKAATGRKAFTTMERFKDIGLVDDNGNFKFQKYVNDGTIVVDNGRIVSLNSHQWSEADRLEIGVALHRHAAQQIQKGFAGEASPWMQRPDVAFLMQFRSYPLLSAEKQFGRQTNFGDREAAVSLAMNAATSALARYIRYSSLALALPEDERERYVSNRMRNNVNYDTLAYMGTPGIFMHNVGVLDALFTKGDTISQIPAVRWAENYVDATQAAGRLAFDEDSNVQRDLSNIQGAAPLGTIGHMNMIMGVIKNTIANEE